MTIFTWLGFAQTEMQQNKIYDALEAFVANPKLEKIKLLDKIEADFYSNKSIKTSDDLLAIVILNCNKAYYLNQFGQIEKAIATYEKAWQLFDKKCSANSGTPSGSHRSSGRASNRIPRRCPKMPWRGHVVPADKCRV